MTDRELFDYLKVEWMNDKDVRRLARNVGVRPPPKRRRAAGRKR